MLLKLGDSLRFWGIGMSSVIYEFGRALIDADSALPNGRPKL